MAQAGRDRTTILGIEFFQGTAAEAVAAMRPGGLLVVPAAPALVELQQSSEYREALLRADLAITDSSFMVLIWNFLEHDSVNRLSGLAYLKELLRQPEVRRPGGTLWVMASAESAERNLAWLAGQGIEVSPEMVYLAPMYGAEIQDEPLLERMSLLRPQNVVLTVGGGTQERLGLYLKQRLSYRPAIHCIGAAIAFLSGDQVHIPWWADKMYLGWLFRSVADPKRYIPRYWAARRLFSLILRYRRRLPDPIR